MGQKVNPTGFRVGHHRGLEEQVVRAQGGVRHFLIEDHKIRNYIDEKLNRRPPFAAVSDIMIERTREEVTITLKTARPGLVIGPKGAEVDKLREQIEDMIHRKVAPVKVIEVKNPDLNAQLVAEGIAEQLKKRASFRRVLKMRIETASRPVPRASGCRSAAGSAGRRSPGREGHERVGPADHAPGRRELRVRGRQTTYGTIGIKVWIFRGMYGEEVLETDVRPGGRLAPRPR
jgi:small subunit ribosomal protein S3